jgi:hypothetical protein
MADFEDVIGPERELTGEKLAPCDICRLPVPQASLVRFAGRPGVAEPVEVLHLCSDCHARVDQGDVSFEEQIAAGLQEPDD